MKAMDIVKRNCKHKKTTYYVLQKLKQKCLYKSFSSIDDSVFATVYYILHNIEQLIITFELTPNPTMRFHAKCKK